MGLLDGRAVVVTGGSSGIGRATAIAFAREGAKVVLSYNSSAKGGEDTAAEISKAGGEALCVKADVAKPSDVAGLIKCVVEAYGRLDCAFNNAGTGGDFGPMIDITEENWDKVMSVNLKGVWLSMKYELPQMVRQGYGVIVNNSSTAGIATGTNINFADYSASKAGINQLTRIAARAYRDKHVRVNAVCPTFVRTPMIDRLERVMPSMKERFSELEARGLLGEPRDIAEAVVWLCSDHARFITGQTLVIDGGATLG